MLTRLSLILLDAAEDAEAAKYEAQGEFIGKILVGALIVWIGYKLHKKFFDD